MGNIAWIFAYLKGKNKRAAETLEQDQTLQSCVHTDLTLPSPKNKCMVANNTIRVNAAVKIRRRKK